MEHPSGYEERWPHVTRVWVGDGAGIKGCLFQCWADALALKRAAVKLWREEVVQGGPLMESLGGVLLK